jgi:hypothetical protein
VVLSRVKSRKPDFLRAKLFASSTFKSSRVKELQRNLGDQESCALAKFSRHHGEGAAKIQNFSAPKLCKAVQATENRVVSIGVTTYFHRLINIHVENFTVQKYFSDDSALRVLTRTRKILTDRKLC